MKMPNYSTLPSKVSILCAFTIFGVFLSTSLAETHYDPEATLAGIPVFSARSLNPQTSHGNGQLIEPERRMNSDSDDDVDDYDEDRDEQKSSSNNHDSYENPAFGESRQATRDGEDIEKFFDKHIGPDNEANGASELDDNESPAQEAPARADNDDHYEVAASSPLAAIFQSLLAAHKRPIVIETSDAPEADSSAIDAPSAYIGGRPYTGPSTPVSPLSPYSSPVAASSSLSQYGPQSQDTETPEANQGDGEDEQVQEMYISRRPTILNHLRNSKLSQQSSEASRWNGSPNSRYPQAGPMAQTDYHQYPVAASYSHQQEQPDDDGTVVYGLSLGGSSSPGSDEEENQEGQSSVDEGPSPYNSYGHRQTSSNHYNSYQQGYAVPQMVPQGYGPIMRVPVSAMGHGQMVQYHPARFHKDPSESVMHPINYGRFR